MECWTTVVHSTPTFFYEPKEDAPEHFARQLFIPMHKKGEDTSMLVRYVHDGTPVCVEFPGYMAVAWVDSRAPIVTISGGLRYFVRGPLVLLHETTVLQQICKLQIQLNLWNVERSQMGDTKDQRLKSLLEAIPRKRIELDYVDSLLPYYGE